MGAIANKKKDENTAHKGSENLIPFNKRTEEEQREIATQGGIASGKARKRKKNLKQCLKVLKDVEPKEEEKVKIANATGLDVEDIDSTEMIMAVSLYNQIRKGNVKAFETYQRTIYGTESKTQKEELKIKKEELKIKKELHELEMRKYRDSQQAKEYMGIPALSIAPNYADVLFGIDEHKYTEYVFDGGRGSLKSSFVSLAIVDLIMKHEDLNALVLRQVSNTIRGSVYNQLCWAIDLLGLNDEFEFTVSPAEITRIRTGQKIFFRGADDPNKIKSIKPAKGYIGVVWFEELDQFKGEEAVRKIEQSAIRGGDLAWIFKSFNPPKSALNWANKYIKIPKESRLVHHSTYLTVPKQWLGKTWIDEAEYLKEVNPIAYENEYMGVANGTGGNVFDNVTIREITDEEIEEFDRIYNGVDWGWFPDPFHFTRCYFNSAQRKLYIFAERRVNKVSNKDNADAILKDFKIGSEVVTCDSAEPKSVGDFRTYGISARGAEKGTGSVDYSMKWLASLNEIIIDNKRAPATADEFINYEYERDKEGNVISGYPDVNNHAIDAVRYATEPIWKRRGR